MKALHRTGGLMGLYTHDGHNVTQLCIFEKYIRILFSANETIQTIIHPLDSIQCFSNPDWLWSNSLLFHPRCLTNRCFLTPKHLSDFLLSGEYLLRIFFNAGKQRKIGKIIFQEETVHLNLKTNVLVFLRHFAAIRWIAFFKKTSCQVVFFNKTLYWHK